MNLMDSYSGSGQNLREAELYDESFAGSQVSELPVYTSKRIMDIALSSLGLIAFLPVGAAAAAAIKVEGMFDNEARGPVFFSQERIGKGGRPFIV